MGCLTDALHQQRFLVLDGGLATELERLGCNLDDPLWSARVLIDAPEKIREVHRNYLQAGADIITTASYQATPQGFEEKGLSRVQSRQLLRLSVELARKERDEFWRHKGNRTSRVKPIVAASVGSYGAYLADGSEYRGNFPLSRKVLMDFHAPRLQELIAAGADVIACETIPCIEEAVALACLLGELDAPEAWISFSCCDGASTCQGDPIALCAQALAPFDSVSAIGINCTSPRFVESLLQRLRQAVSKPLVAYPNSGESYCADGKQWQGSSETSSMGALAMSWKKAGAFILGGCCRTTPQDIADIAFRCRSSSVAH